MLYVLLRNISNECDRDEKFAIEIAGSGIFKENVEETIIAIACFRE